ncbi:hypothetical protein PGQ11_007981 [Apiospora arundinis]|uniref:Rhodopsin domain-containing protein n=1 Tax=Apiospora arundinis TaxID=335852 RepID=A0ABR2IXN6_9PEZI
MADSAQIANVELRKIWFAMNYLFDAGLYLPKASMVAIYYHLIPVHFHTLRRALHFIGFLVASSFFITFFSDTFWCGPRPSIQWHPSPDSCSAYESKTLMQLNWPLCFTCEALLFILPFPLLHRLSLSRREKNGLIGIFALGAVTIGVSSGRFATMIMKGNDISLFVWGTAEFSVSTMIVAATALRPLVRKGWQATTSTSRRSGSGLGKRRHNFFRACSRDTTGDSMNELEASHSAGQQSSSWPDDQTTEARHEIPLSPMMPVSRAPS